ncbi:MAG: tol-pal system protein YbgF, partial [Pseudomonadota bacterium]
MNIIRILLLNFVVVCLVFTAPNLAMAETQMAEYSPDNPDATNGDAAGLQVRISELEEQIRKLQGTIEQVSFENRSLKTQIEKSSQDVDFRLTALEKAQLAQPQSNRNDNAGNTDQIKPMVDKAPEDSEKSHDEDKAAPEQSFTTPKEHYNYAFKLLNQSKYSEAGQSFAAFNKKYPKDPLIGNSYYWLGETYYVGHDYIKAADNFRRGYEAAPTGPKAADNLLKLAISMNNLNKNKEACIVLNQITVKFANASSTKV